MRPIKFRAWDVVEHKYYKNVQNSENCETNRFWSFNQVLEEVDNWHLVLEEFTGLKDSNGTEIYEGDILEFQDFVFGGKPRSKRTIVEWSEGDAAFVTGFRNLWKLVELGAVVVGNVHENPELLGGHDVRNQK